MTYINLLKNYKSASLLAIFFDADHKSEVLFVFCLSAFVASIYFKVIFFLCIIAILLTDVLNIYFMFLSLSSNRTMWQEQPPLPQVRWGRGSKYLEGGLFVFCFLFVSFSLRLYFLKLFLLLCS